MLQNAKVTAFTVSELLRENQQRGGKIPPSPPRLGLKKHEAVTDNRSVMIYVNEIENRINFKIKTGYYLELLMPETMKLLGSTKSNITKDKNGENMPRLEITEVVLIHCNFVNSDYQQDSRVLYTFVPNESFG